tara:strand:- start:118 stop:999 length:882 start_codon:yes stop_codon:yes gene_type:complete
MNNNEEYQYLNLIKDVLNNGYWENTRNGKTITKFGVNMRFSLKDNNFPLLTTKKMAWKSCAEELFWFIRGSTDNEELKNKNVKIWNANSSREFLDSRGLYNNKENDLGPIYGFQWRHFNASYNGRYPNYEKKGVDQLQNIIDDLKNIETRNSRRHILTSWNPCQINEMALPPCHLLCQFNVRENKYLSCALYQRSGDIGLGIPFNIASYSLFTIILAKHCGLIPDEFVHFIGNAHIYENHVDGLKMQIDRVPLTFPKIQIKNIYDNINDYNINDIEWISKYQHLDSIKMDMVA